MPETSNSHFEKYLCESGSCPQSVGWVQASKKSWQDATHTASIDKSEFIVRIAVTKQMDLSMKRV